MTENRSKEMGNNSVIFQVQNYTSNGNVYRPSVITENEIHKRTNGRVQKRRREKWTVQTLTTISQEKQKPIS